VVTAAVFAVRVRPGAEPALSREHDGARWLGIGAALDEVVWPGYREALRRIRGDLLRPDRAPWFELDLEGRRRHDAVDSAQASSAPQEDQRA
jgi:hypothetical protein